MAIAFGRFGTFKRFLVSIFDHFGKSQQYVVFVKVRSVKDFFVFLKNKIIEAVTGRRPYEEEFDEGEKGYQVFTHKKTEMWGEIVWLAYVVEPMCVNIETPLLSVNLVLI